VRSRAFAGGSRELGAVALLSTNLPTNLPCVGGHLSDLTAPESLGNARYLVGVPSPIPCPALEVARKHWVKHLKAARRGDNELDKPGVYGSTPATSSACSRFRKTRTSLTFPSRRCVAKNQ
jgi:hypothetical protein